MRDRETTVRTFQKTLAGVGIVVVLVLVYNVWLFFSEGLPTMPTLDKQYWGGYYQQTASDKVWCLSRFYKDERGELKMLLTSASIRRAVFNVEQDSGGRTFIEYTMHSDSSRSTIEGQQLYVGKRYFFGRLAAGRFRDFWKMNDDVAIRGILIRDGAKGEFAIEPLAKERAVEFVNRLVLPADAPLSPADIASIMQPNISNRLGQ